MKKNINKFGFTLIELLVVVTIIGILLTGATTIYKSGFESPLRDFIKEVGPKIEKNNLTSTGTNKIVTKEAFINFVKENNLGSFPKKFTRSGYGIYFNGIENGSFCVGAYKVNPGIENIKIGERTKFLKDHDKYFYEYCSLIQEGDDKKVALSLLDLEKDKTGLLK